MKRTLLISLAALTPGACAGREVRQPRHALEPLQGGHRVRAAGVIEEIRAALVEVRAGTEFDEEH